MVKNRVEASLASPIASTADEFRSALISAKAFLGTSTLVSPVTATLLFTVSMCARRCPSVATIVIDACLISSKAPFNVYRDSSCEMAKIVLPIIVCKTRAGSWMAS